MKYHSKYILALFFTALIISCSKDQLTDTTEAMDTMEASNTEAYFKNQSNLESQARKILADTYSLALDNAEFDQKIPFAFEENQYESYIFYLENEAFVATYSLKENSFNASTRFLQSVDGARDIILTNLNSSKSETLNAMPEEGNCNEGESCAGCHYRVMMDIIESDGDMDFWCTINFACPFQVYAAAVAHCKLRH